MTDDSYKGWFLEWIEEWSQLLPGYNWRTFHPIIIEVEDDRMMGGIEATVIVLGLGVRVRWNYAVTEKVADIQEQVRKINEVYPPEKP